MHFSITSPNHALETECLIVPVFTVKDASGKAVFDMAAQSAGAKALDVATQSRLFAPLMRQDIQANVGTTLLRSEIDGLNDTRVLLVGAGDTEKLDTVITQRILNAAFDAACTLRVTHATLLCDGLLTPEGCPASLARSAAESALRASYRFTACKSIEGTPVTLNSVALCSEADAGTLQKGLDLGRATGLGINYARELANLPGNRCTPRYLAEQAEQLGQQHALDVTILDEAALETLGAGALLAVGKGSEEPSRMIVMHYRGAEDSEAPHVLVGKGVTFDTGGISLKPGLDMDEMRYDMGGAASVFGTMQAILELKPKINVVGIIASAENMPDGKALKPGDIIKTLNGMTVEVLNTDAEGRLVLCDALAYAERYNPASVVDIATLTGACMIALGDHASGLFSNDDDLTLELLDAAELSGDRVWQLPLWDDYQSQLDSNFADVANIGGRKAGAITAACFLSRFAKKYAWAHLDIASTGWHGKQGATGRPVGLLTQYLMDREATLHSTDD